jgi:hypothetical protein
LLLRCTTAGHDTVWADTFYEALIPDPIQLQYTLHNDGTMISPSVSVAIVLPPVFALAAGEDSVKTLPALLPGASASAEWMLDIVQSEVAPGEASVRWVVKPEFQPPAHCEHDVTFLGRAPDGVVLTPWLLRFIAERLGDIPASKTVSIWTGGGPTPAWSVARSPSWLSTIPLDGYAQSSMTVQPSTTDLPLGDHRGMIELLPLPVDPGNIQVIYTIQGAPSSVVPQIAESVSLQPPYPNPVRRGQRTSLTYRLPPFVLSQVTLRDVLGREVFSRRNEKRADTTGSIVLDTRELWPGIYFVIVRTANAEAVRSVIVLP